MAKIEIDRNQLTCPMGKFNPDKVEKVCANCWYEKHCIWLNIAQWVVKEGIE